jgi:hypothetical protein
MEQFVTAYTFFEFCDRRRRKRRPECDYCDCGSRGYACYVTIYRTNIQTVEGIHPTIGIMFQLTKKSDYLEHTFIDSYFSCFAVCNKTILWQSTTLGESE